jgi:hypothetical protein
MSVNGTTTRQVAIAVGTADLKRTSAAKFAVMHNTAPVPIVFAKISNCVKSATAIEA